jgi:phosphoribosyl 1,2-cyclic phosphodiesterase
MIVLIQAARVAFEEIRMSLHFTVLASGSAGNACLLEAGAFTLLLDAGIGPRTLAKRLEAIGASWDDIDAAILTHTHSDHWNERTFRHLHKRVLRFYCHAEHADWLNDRSAAFRDLYCEDRVRFYEAGELFHVAPNLSIRPLPVRHDSGATFGFRFETTADIFGRPRRLGYATDLGCWNGQLVRALADVDLLALEFNHDVAMEEQSGRAPELIARVLGDEGHLSNAQAAGLLEAVLGLSEPGRLRHLVQLHLSQECNRPALAVRAATAALTASMHTRIHTAKQERASRRLVVGGSGNQGTRRRWVFNPAQMVLPGMAAS